MNTRQPDETEPGFFHVRHRRHDIAALRCVRDYRAFVAALAERLRMHPMRVLAYSILPTQWQLVVGPADPHDVHRLVERVSTTQGERLPGGRVDPVPDQPAESLPEAARPIVAASHLVQRCEEVESSALRAGLVHRAQDWPWCSLFDRLLARPSVPLADTPFLSSRTWIEHVNAAGRHWSERSGRLSHVRRTSRHVPDHAGVFPRAAERVEQGLRIVRPAHEHHADTHVECSEHLVV
jgi:hypothetical protein